MNSNGDSVVIPGRTRLPKRRRCLTQKVHVDGHAVFYSWSVFPDGRLGAMFIDMAKAGSALRFWTTGFARLFSVALQHGMPLTSMVEMFVDSRSDPCGLVTGHARITKCTSILDLVVRSLAVDYLGREDLADVPDGNTVLNLEIGFGTSEDAI